MDKLIEVTVSFLEIMVLGALTVIALGYLAALAPRVKNELAGYATRLTELLFETGKLGQANAQRVRIAVILGLVYYAGVLANATAYWVLQPAQLDVIWQVANANSGSQGRDPSATGLAGFAWLPLCRKVPEGGWQEYGEYLRREAAWGNLKLDASRNALDDIWKQVRLIRGTALFALCLALIALLKSVIAFPCSFLGRCRWLYWCYREIVDTRSERLRMYWKRDKGGPEPTEEQMVAKLRSADRKYVGKAMVRVAALKMVIPNLLVVVLAGLLYVASMGCYRVMETEYYMLVWHGEKTAVQAVTPAESAKTLPKAR